MSYTANVCRLLWPGACDTAEIYYSFLVQLQLIHTSMLFPSSCCRGTKIPVKSMNPCTLTPKKVNKSSPFFFVCSLGCTQLNDVNDHNL